MEYLLKYFLEKISNLKILRRKNILKIALNSVENFSSFKQTIKIKY